MKLVIVNSNGPMGSSLVSALVEKFGYLNVPLRDLGIHDYLIGAKTIEDDFYKQNFIKVLRTDSTKIKGGGVNVPDRDNSPSYRRLNAECAVEAVEKIREKRFLKISDMYGGLRDVYAELLKYKQSKHVPGKHVELTIDLSNYEVDQLCDAYRREFKEVHFIHLHRDFIGWLESIASQRFASPPKRFRFLLHELYQRYCEYEKNTKAWPGLHVDFDTLFRPENKKLIADIALELNEPVPDIQWKEERYDLFGNLSGYEKTFTQADVEGKYLSSVTRKVIQYCVAKKKITLLDDAVVYAFYLADLFLFFMEKQFSTQQFPDGRK